MNIGADFNFISSGSKEAILLLKHSIIMSYSKNIFTVNINIGSLSLANAQVCVRAHNLVCWTEVAIDKDAAQQHRKEV